MAGRIPQDFVDQVLARVDIVELIDARVGLKKAGREYEACCPFHGEKTPSFKVSPSKQFFHCFGCGAHGTALGFLMDYEHLEFREAIEELARMAGLQIPVDAGPAPVDDRDLYGVMQMAEQHYRRQLRDHPTRGIAIDYLRKRGLSGDIAQRYGIGYAPAGWDGLIGALTARGIALDKLDEVGLVSRRDGRAYDRFRERIMFPIRDRRGRTIGFGGRVIGTGEPKYLNSPETPLFHKGRELYGLHEARQQVRKIERLLVVEGYMDVVALAQHDIGYALATLGTATTPDHAEQLFRLTREVVFCFDGDRAGREAAWRAAENVLPLMKDGRQAQFLFLPDGEDPDSLVRSEGRAGFEQRMSAAEPLSDFLIRARSEGLDLQRAEGRARLIDTFRPLLEKLPEGSYRELLAQRVQELTGIRAGDLLGTARRPPQTLSQHKAVRAETPARWAIALLLSNPDHARQVENPRDLLELDEKGIPMLVELIETCLSNPHLSSGAQLVERFRDRPEAPHLRRLLGVTLDLPETEHGAAFIGTIERLRERSMMPTQGRRLNQVLERLRMGVKPAELTDDERQALRFRIDDNR